MREATDTTPVAARTACPARDRPLASGPSGRPRRRGFTTVATATAHGHGPFRARASEESGFTLTEILVVLVMLTFLMTAVFGLLTQSGRVANSDIARDTSLNEQTTAFSRMIDELRQGYQVNCPTGGCTGGASSNSIDFDERITTTGQKDRRIAYNCGVAQPGTSWNECVRYETAASDTTDSVPLGPSCSSCTSKVVIKRVANNPVFVNLTPATSASGAARWVSGTATIYTPTGGTTTGSALSYKSDVILREQFFMSQLDFGQ